MRAWFLSLLACLPVLGAWAQPLPVPPRETVAFVGVHVLPMDSDRALAGQTVLVKDGRIVAMGDALPLPEGVRVVEGEGAWLLPGLADMHNHLDGRQDLVVQLALGITTTLHMGEARNSFVGRTRAAVAAGELAGPRSFVALAVDGSPRYGHLVVRDADDARATLRVAQANGYDALKLYNNLPPDAFEALMLEAHAVGMPVVGHGVTEVGLQRQLEAGMALVAHLEEFFYTFFPPAPDDDPNAAPDPAQIEAAVALLRTHGTPVVADLVTYRAIAAQWGRPEVVAGFLRRPETRYLPPQFRVSWPAQGYVSREGSLDRRVAFLSEFVRALQAAGVPLLSGTDAQDIPGLVAGFALHDNLDALVEAGLSPYEVLVTATRAPGEFVRSHRPDLAPSGVITSGARADLVLVRTDPRDGLATLRHPLGVMADGRWYSGDDLAAHLEAVAREYAAAAHSAQEPPGDD